MKFHHYTLLFQATLCFIFLYTMLFLSPVGGTICFVIYYMIFLDHIRMCKWQVKYLNYPYEEEIIND